ncbi:hypothetical protein BE221DRAFT_50132, partial [Ostreococcus tauri]
MYNNLFLRPASPPPRLRLSIHEASLRERHPKLIPLPGVRVVTPLHQPPRQFHPTLFHKNPKRFPLLVALRRSQEGCKVAEIRVARTREPSPRVIHRSLHRLRFHPTRRLHRASFQHIVRVRREIRVQTLPRRRRRNPSPKDVRAQSVQDVIDEIHVIIRLRPRRRRRGRAKREVHRDPARRARA